jgi:hypothetical protein
MAGAKKEKDEVTFSPREMEVLAIAWQCMETQPKVCLPSLPLPSSQFPTPAHLPSPPSPSPPTNNPAQIDMTKLTSLTGYTVGSASVTFGRIKSKLKLMGESLSADGPAPPKTTPKGTPKGAAKTTSRAKATPNGKRGAAAYSTPSKRQKKAPQPTSSASCNAAAVDDDDDDEDFSGMGVGGAKIKKEEDFDRSFPELDSPLHEQEEERAASYNFLEGIEQYAGGGRAAGGAGYRAPFAKDEQGVVKVGGV